MDHYTTGRRGWTRQEFLVAGFGACSGLMLAGCSGGAGQSFPQRPVQLVLPAAPGGSTDLLGRFLASEIQLEESVNVENREGGNGTIAAAEVASTQPDGHTMLLSSLGAFATEPVLREVQYKIGDFRGITGLTNELCVLAVNADSPWQTLEDLLEDKRNSGEVVRAGQSGAGSYLRLAHDALYQEAGVETNNVPFDGGGPTVTALLGDEIDSAIAHPPELIQQAEAGDVRLIGVFSEEQSDLLPDVPTVKEEGFDIVVNVTKFLLVPADTPNEAVQTLQDAINKFTESQQYSQFLADNLFEPYDVRGEEVVEQLRQEQEQARQLIQELDVQVNQ